MALIRYPGSKAKLARAIVDHFPWHVDLSLWKNVGAPAEYREPFFGAGAVGFHVLRSLHPACRVWLNDVDPGVTSLWRAVMNVPDKLHAMVDQFEPSMEEWERLREYDQRRNGDPDEVAGFNKLALHQLSYSGLGARAGGPLGGRGQRSEFPIGCRWKPPRLHREIEECSRRLRRFKHCTITTGDFALLVDSAPVGAFIYCDPPYYEKGQQLYLHSMDDGAHRRLADALLRCAAQWRLSYDDHTAVRQLYAGCEIAELEITYTTATAYGSRRPKNCELLIAPSDAVRSRIRESA